ncbi:hypothetical protein L7F22_032134 [Adiantum nelumboides]|nr:hypothetical protein [Adiantum nelumboides]
MQVLAEKKIVYAWYRNDKFFPRTEKYVSLFEGNEDEEVLAKRTKLREQIKANLAALEAAGVEPENMHKDEDPTMAMSDDDFFLVESLSDNAEAGNESPFTSSKTRPKSTSKKTAMPNARHTSVSSRKQSYKVSHNEHSGSKNHKQSPKTMSDDDFFLAESSSDNAETSSRHTSISNKGQSFKFPHNARSGSDSLKQRSAPTFRNKDNQRQYTIGADNKIKGRNMDDQMHHPVSKDSKIKEDINTQKLKFAPYSSSLSQRHSGRQQARSKPTSSRSVNVASSVIAKNIADDFNVPSRASLDAAKNATVSEIGSLSLLAPKKRRRKHRPKKKKT